MGKRKNKIKMKTALRNLIISKSDITDIVESRVYSFPAPQGAVMPYLLVQRITETPGRNLNAPNELYREMWQIGCYAETDSEAERLKNAVREHLDICSPFTMGDFTVYNMFLESSNDLSELELSGGQQGVYRRNMDFIIIRKKTAN